jgi:hypothetical protein
MAFSPIFRVLKLAFDASDLYFLQKKLKFDASNLNFSQKCKAEASNASFQETTVKIRSKLYAFCVPCSLEFIYF